MNLNNLDDPKTTVLRKDIFLKKGFVRKIYQDWYTLIQKNLWDGNGLTLELGSGAGFINSLIPKSFTSDVLFLPFVDMVLNGANLPFPKNSLNNLIMIDVFHHIPNVDRFLDEAERALAPGGRIIMIEPWMNPWSLWVYSNLHHETIDLKAETWDFLSSGPLSGANQALPWIVFERDRIVFEKKFPNLKIKDIGHLMPFLYLLSGGFRNKLSLPSFSYAFWKKIEKIAVNKNKWGMFGLIVLEKIK